MKTLNNRTILEDNFALLRLDDEQRIALRHAIEWLDCDVYAFGSRTDKSKRGGDIDILVLSNKREYKLSMDIARRFLEICDDKLDVVVAKPENPTDFASLILNQKYLIRLL